MLDPLAKGFSPLSADVGHGADIGDYGVDVERDGEQGGGDKEYARLQLTAQPVTPMPVGWLCHTGHNLVTHKLFWLA